jgi:hypothetical protein
MRYRQLEGIEAKRIRQQIRINEATIQEAQYNHNRAVIEITLGCKARHDAEVLRWEKILQDNKREALQTGIELAHLRDMLKNGVPIKENEVKTDA